MVDDASGMVVTKDTNNIPSVLDAMPVMSAISSVLQARKNPAITTPSETSPNIAQAFRRVIPGSFSSSPSSAAGRFLYTHHMPKTKKTIRTMEDIPTSPTFAPH